MAAMTWAIWKRGARLSWLIMTIIVACATAAWSAADKSKIFDQFEAGFYLLMMLSIALIFGIFHHAEFNPHKDWHGFPYRMFTLPVPTWLLVCCPMVLGIIVVELVYFAWAWLIFEPLGVHISLWPAAVLGAGLPCYQAMVWSLSGFRIARLIALAAAGMFLMDLGALPVFSSSIHIELSRVYLVSSLILAGLTAGSFLCAWFFLEKQRRGGGRGWGIWRGIISLALDALPRRCAKFQTPGAAQFWLEWRRAGLVLPVCTTAALLLVFAPVGWFLRENSEATLWTLGWLVVLPMILAIAIGQGFIKPDFWSRSISLPTFEAVRPISVEDMVLGKMKAALLGAVLAWIPLLVFTAFWLAFVANTTDLRDLWTTATVLYGLARLKIIMVLGFGAAVILTWRNMVSGLWAGLSGSMTRYVVAVVWQLTTLAVAIWAFFFVTNHFRWQHLEEYVFWLQWALTLAVALKVWLAVLSWRKITPRRVGQYTIIWLAGTVWLLALGWLVCPNIFWLKPLVIIVAFLPFPLARLGFAPGALISNRHRQ